MIEHIVLASFIEMDKIVQGLEEKDFIMPENWKLYQELLSIYEKYGCISKALLQAKKLPGLKLLEDYNAVKEESALNILIEEMRKDAWKFRVGKYFKRASESDVWFDQSTEEISSVMNNFLNEELKKYEFDISEYLEIIMEEIMNPKKVEMPSGIISLDNLIGGLKKGRVHLLGARPSSGKTSLLVNVTSNLLDHGKRCLIVPIEGGPKSFLRRLISLRGEINNQLFEHGSENAIANIAEKLIRIKNNIASLPLFFLENTNPSLGEIKDAVRKYKPDFVGIDYLQVMNMEGVKGDNRNQQLGYIMKELVVISIGNDVSILCLSQLSRAVDKRTPPIPSLQDIRDSGEIEADADVIGFLYYPHHYNRDESINDLHLIVEKHKDGPLGYFKLYFEPKYYKIADIFGNDQGYNQ
ncbi:MAG: hypothetical protein DRH33_04120 [Candidatus Nealsonbacteria bacterium]|nr:MAG: hypothetical protein DRH33_04120 [Candidatus Nealsonbacteria bacterium]